MSTRALQVDLLLDPLIDPLTGDLCSGYSVEFYAAGTSTAKNVWTEKEKTNPFTTYTLDSGGKALLYGDGVYKIIVKNLDATAVLTLDNLKVQATTFSVVQKTGTYTATPDDDVILCDGTFTVNLQTVANFEHPLTIKNIGSGTITVDPYSTQTIDAATTYTLPATDEVTIYPDTVSTKWRSATSTAISSRVELTAAAAADVLLIEDVDDSGEKKFITAQNFLNSRYAIASKWYYLSEYASLLAAITAIDVTNANLVIDTTGSIAADLTIPANVSLSWFKPGCTITIATTKTLTINSKFPDMLTQLFVLTGTGKVVFGTNATEHVRPEWAGAAGNASTDDSTAVQATVTCCLSTVARPIPMKLSGRYKIATPVNIDRQVGSSPDYFGTGLFRIIGEGRAAGFYATTAISMFSSTLVDHVTPQSEGISFENVQFEVDAATTAAYVLDGEAFLRVQFVSCRFFMIKCLSSSIYVQSFYFVRCLIRLWSGVFLAAPADTCYDISFSKCSVESGDALWTAGTVSGCRFVDNLVEYITGRPIKTIISNGFFIAGNYFESCDMSTAGTTDDPYIETGVPLGVTLFGNHFALTAGQISDADFYAVNWWEGTITGSYSASVLSAGNYCSGKLHNKTGLLTYGDDKGWVSLGDKCTDSPYPTSGIRGTIRMILTDYVDNAAALAGGLTAGQFYRTSGVVMVVI